MSKSDLAIKLHDKGYNCAQAVACAFAEDLKIPKETLFAVCEGLGFGMGSAEEACGALSGAVIIAGLKNSTRNLDLPNSKKETYLLAGKIRESFKSKVHGTVCKEIKGLESGKMLCSCADCIKAGAEAIEEVLKI